MGTVSGKICLRCGHKWLPRKAGRPATCPSCRDPKWDLARENKEVEIPKRFQGLEDASPSELKFLRKVLATLRRQDHIAKIAEVVFAGDNARDERSTGAR